MRTNAVAQIVWRARTQLRRSLRRSQVDVDRLPDACRARLDAMSDLVDRASSSADGRPRGTHGGLPGLSAHARHLPGGRLAAARARSRPSDRCGDGPSWKRAPGRRRDADEHRHCSSGHGGRRRHRRWRGRSREPLRPSTGHRAPAARALVHRTAHVVPRRASTLTVRPARGLDRRESASTGRSVARPRSPRLVSLVVAARATPIRPPAETTVAAGSPIRRPPAAARGPADDERDRTRSYSGRRHEDQGGEGDEGTPRTVGCAPRAGEDAPGADETPPGHGRRLRATRRRLRATRRRLRATRRRSRARDDQSPGRRRCRQAMTARPERRRGVRLEAEHADDARERGQGRGAAEGTRACERPSRDGIQRSDRAHQPAVPAGNLRSSRAVHPSWCGERSCDEARSPREEGGRRAPFSPSRIRQRPLPAPCGRSGRACDAPTGGRRDVAAGGSGRQQLQWQGPRLGLDPASGLAGARASRHHAVDEGTLRP